MIRALPDQYAHFTSSLLLLGTLDKTQLRDAFLAEEVNRRRRAQVDSALHSSSTTANSTCTHPNCHHCNQSTTSTRIQCDFCGLLGHTQDKCHRYIISRQQAVEGAKNRYKRGNKAQAGSSNSQNTSQQPKSSPNNANSSTVVTESAENASLRSIHPSDPHCPLQLDADIDWNADTGATSHMTPHRHWVHHYTPYRVPIKLADHTVVYSAGVGTVVFNPVM
ncbi:hypothetical protein SERLADRAFT_351077, partial [Serpula lacrymans var. lacrymans S7.9]